MALISTNTPLGESSSLSIDWQLNCSEIKQRAGNLLQSGQWADCSFLVGSQSRQIIKAHKLILASASPVFEAMFFGGMAEGDGPIEILDVQPDAFKILMLYIYTDKTVITSFDKACSVYYAAKKYMLPYLVKELSWYISINLSPQNVCRAYELGQLFDETILVDQCLKMMEYKTKDIVIDDSFLEADLKTVHTLLSLDHLNIESEMDLFNAIEKYAQTHLKSGQYKRRSDVDLSSSTCQRCASKMMKRSSSQDESMNYSVNEMHSVLSTSGNEADCSKRALVRHEETGELVPKASTGISAGGNDGQTCIATDNEDTMSTGEDNNVINSQNSSSIFSDDGVGTVEVESLRQAIGKLRFLTLTATSFAAGPARSPLLSESEAFAVLMNILSSAADVPMPPGFSTCRVPRKQLIGGGPSTSENIDSEMCEDKSEAIFRFTVLNFKSRRRSVESRPFSLHGAPWTLRLVPRVDCDTAGNERQFCGLYLKCMRKVSAAAAAGALRVRGEVRVLAAPPAQPLAAPISKIFTSKEREWGVERFVSWNEVVSSERGLLRGNALTLEARLVADTPP